MPTDPKEMEARFRFVENVVDDEERFIRTLGIGRDAYASLRIGRRIGTAVNVSTAAGAGAAVAASGTVASTFFAGTGWLAVLGLGGAAVTPIGWVLAGAVATGGLYYGAMRAFGAYEDVLVDDVPVFINTPIDLLGAVIVDLMGGIALHVAQADGAICDRERAHVRDYFAGRWGIDRAYAGAALGLIEEGLSQASLDDRVSAFAGFAGRNPDCKLDALRGRVAELLSELVEVDDRVTDAERAAIRRVDTLLSEAGRPRLLPQLPDMRRTWLGRALIGVNPEAAKQIAPAA